MPSIIFIDYIVTTLLYQSNVRNHLYSLYKENHISLPLLDKTAELWQRRPRDAPNIWVPWKVL